MIIVIHSETPSLPAADNQVLPAVAIHIGPSHCRTQSAELSRQTWLPLKIVKLALMMRVPQQIADVFEEWLGWCFRRLEKFRGACLINLINPVGFHFFHDASFASSPDHFERHASSHFSRCENGLRIRS